LVRIRRRLQAGIGLPHGPLIEDCPVLRPLVMNPQDKRGGGNNLLAKEFPGGILAMTGANSSKGLRSMAARYVFLDEVDGYPGDVEGEGDPCDLAITRTVNFPRRKIFVTSTPVISGRSRIERFYEQSDQCQYFEPCPQCGGMQVLRFEALRWPKNKPHEAVYPCEHCSSEIQDSAKNWILPRGEWRPQANGDGLSRGYHLSSLYSPPGWLSWAQVASKYEKAYGDREKLQVFWNTVLGRPWAEIAETPDHERLYERREHYQIGKVPVGGLLLTAGADVQLKRIEVEIVAWGRRKQSWSVDYRVLEGDTQQPEVWRELAETLDEDFLTEYGAPVRITKLAVDSGFNTTPVYDFVRKMQASRVMAIKGDSRTSALIGAPSMIEVGPQVGARSSIGFFTNESQADSASAVCRIVKSHGAQDSLDLDTVGHGPGRRCGRRVDSSATQRFPEARCCGRLVLRLRYRSGEASRAGCGNDPRSRRRGAVLHPNQLGCENQRPSAARTGPGRNELDSRRRLLDGQPGGSHDGCSSVAPRLCRWLLDGHEGSHQRAV
jgi:hypothetical protein